MQLLPHALPTVQILQQAVPVVPGKLNDRPPLLSSRGIFAILQASEWAAISTNVPSLLARIEIVPSRSVRCTRAPTLCHCWIPLEEGCPYEFRAPPEMTATSGRVLSIHSVMLPFQLP